MEISLDDIFKPGSSMFLINELADQMFNSSRYP